MQKQIPIKNINKSLLALACGDSYGSCYESDGLIGCKFDIDELPNKPLNPMLTDDTKMATILLRHYARHNKEINLNILLHEYMIWAKHDGLIDGIGLHTASVLMQRKEDKNSQGNGALMRVIPFGLQLIDDGHSFNDACEIMNQDSFLTHENSTIAMANRVALDLAMRGVECLKKPEYKEFLYFLHLGNTAWVLHTLYIVIKTLKQSMTFLEGFKYIVSYGGDTDTNCAVYGAIRGYRESIDEELTLDDFLTPEMAVSLVSYKNDIIN